MAPRRMIPRYNLLNEEIELGWVDGMQFDFLLTRQRNGARLKRVPIARGLRLNVSRGNQKGPDMIWKTNG